MNLAQVKMPWVASSYVELIGQQQKRIGYWIGDQDDLQTVSERLGHA